MRHIPVPERLEREAGAALARPPRPAFTLATYVHLLPDDLPDVGFLDELIGVPIRAAGMEETAEREEATA